VGLYPDGGGERVRLLSGLPFWFFAVFGGNPLTIGTVTRV
jgi:hypothetical protein